MSVTEQSNKSLREELQLLFARAKLPTSPTLAAKILELVNDPRSTPQHFAAAIRTDPGLSARLLARANSAYFAQRVPVSTIERAVTVLGLRRLKTTALAFQLVAHLNRLGGARYDLKAFWQHSLLRACLARAVADHSIKERSEEAYLIGLLLDCGIPVLVQLLGDKYAALARNRRLSPTALFTAERSSFRYTHVDAAAALAAEWNLPALIATPLAQHHHEPVIDYNACDTDRLCAVAFFAGGLAFDKKSRIDASEPALQGFRENVLGLDDEDWLHAQELAVGEFNQDSALYQDLVGENLNIAELLAEANRHLAAATEDSDRNTIDAESKRSTIFRKHVLVSSALRDYRERAANDPLTNLANRGALVEIARNAIARNLSNPQSLGVLFIDLDNFKHLNDTFGHAAGDDVLKTVAATLQHQVGDAGKVGRFGGEEFVAVVEGLAAEDFRRLAENCVSQVREAASDKPRWGMITCSIGGFWAHEVPVRSAEDLFSLADDLMYEAKQRGKNRCCLRLLGDPSDAEPDAETPVVDVESEHEADDPTMSDLLLIARRLTSVESEPIFTNARKEPRDRAIQPCTLRLFCQGGHNPRSFDAATCDISAGGICALVGLPVARGELVELVFDHDGEQKYTAGLVASCRHVVGSVHEIGIQVIQRSYDPIIVGDANETMRRLRRHLLKPPGE